MFTCISIRSNYLAKHPPPVKTPQVHWKLKTITKLLVKFWIDNPVNILSSILEPINKSLVPFWWPSISGFTTFWINGFATFWIVLWVVESQVSI